MAFNIRTIRLLGLVIVLVLSGMAAKAQIKPPGYDREMQKMQQSRTEHPFDRDSIQLTDTIVVFDPDTYQETHTVVQRNISIADYCRYLLGINDPKTLTDGKPRTIVHPDTYEEMTIRWNASTGRIDTLK